MKNPVASIKTLVLLSTIAFAGQVLAAQDPWFSGTANYSDFDLVQATTNHPAEGVEIANDTLSIDLPTGEVFQIAPVSEVANAGENKKTYVAVDDAVFTPTAYEDIDNSVVVGAQTALTVAYDANNATNYYAYVGGSWTKLDGATPREAPVNVTIELDYSSSEVTNASFKIGETMLYQYGDSAKTSFQISGSQRYLGRVDLAGYGSIHSVTTTVEAVANLTITPGDVTYGADFTNVTITATIVGDGAASATYTLNWKGSTYDMTIVSHDGNNYTLSAQIPSPASGRESVNYTISATVNDTPAGTSEPATTVVVDNRNWVTENADNQHTTGTWLSDDVAYVGDVATVADNTYTANSCTTGDLVTITFENLVYTEFSDLTVETPDGTQGAFALAEDNGVTSFYILAKPGEDYVWTRAAWAGGTPSTNVAYTVEMAFNYTNNTYSVKVSDESNSGSLSVNSATEFNICKESTKVTGFVFKGSGTMTGIQGVDSIGYMAKDNAGHWYATIDDAAGSGGREFIVLRPTGPAPSGWKFVTVDGVKKLIKNVAKGMFFMAY